MNAPPSSNAETQMNSIIAYSLTLLQLFIYSLLKAVRLGFLDDREGRFVRAARYAYEYALENWVTDNGDGTMSWEGTVHVSLTLRVRLLSL